MKREGADDRRSGRDPQLRRRHARPTTSTPVRSAPVPTNSKGNDAACSVVFKYGMKRDFNLWLASLGPGAPVKTLTELRNYNLANQARGAIKYGQAQFDISDEMNLDADRARYLADRAKDIFLARTHGIDEAMDRQQPRRADLPGQQRRRHLGQGRAIRR